MSSTPEIDTEVPAKCSTGTDVSADFPAVRSLGSARDRHVMPWYSGIKVNHPDAPV